MLTLAYAAEHPESVGPLVLIGCGTFDKDARARMQETIDERMSAGLRKRMRSLDKMKTDPDGKLKAAGELFFKIYSYDPLTDEDETEKVDARAHEETWQDMLRLQNSGTYPRAFSAIRSPVLMLHGTYDPHPGRMILASLKPYVPQIEYCEWEHCGHYPWLEKEVHAEFFSVLKRWLTDHLPSAKA
jgi:pimeloyl-ACP methyl ester carboxylesterase